MLLRCLLRRGVLAVLLATMTLAPGLWPTIPPVYAASVSVTSLADGGGACPSASACTLRDALTAAAPGDTIVIGVTGLIVVSSTLTLTKNVTIQGPGAANLAVDGDDAVGVFAVNNGVQAAISGLTIQRGRAQFGGGILNLGTLAVTNSTLQHNASTVGGDGGAIASNGALTVTDSVIRNNAAALFGAGISSSGAGTVTIVRSTISNNASASLGAGIYSTSTTTTSITNSAISGNTATNGAAGVVNFNGTTTLVNSTVSGNSGGAGGGGVQNVTGTLTLTNSTVSGNSGPSIGGAVRLRNSIVVNSSGSNCTTPAVSLGNNLSDTADCITNGAQGDIVTGAPVLEPLAVNSPGVTATHALLAGSPAIDAVTFNPTDCGTVIMTDQRGVARPQTISGPRCDIGAFEYLGNALPTVSAIGDLVTNEDTRTDGIPFTVDDAETAAASLGVSATSNNQVLLPNSGIELSGSGAARWLQLTPATNQFGSAQIDVAVTDGTATTHETFLLTVISVPDPPVAANDSYSVAAGQTLTVPVGTGVLANDTDIDTVGLTAELVQGTASGALTLNPNGGFSYTPTSSFAGPATFTYRASDSSTYSNVATVTITVVPSSCLPRPRVTPSPSVSSGKLLVHVEATPLNTQQNNSLQSVTFDALDNARVTLGGQNLVAGQTFVSPPNTHAVDFTVERILAGHPTTVHLTVVDGCGTWKTFVGGGINAGF